MTRACAPQIDLRHNQLGEEGAKALAPAIRDSRSLTECDLRHNNLGKEGWCAIFDALRDNPQNKIAKWDLNGQGINEEIVKSLAAYMAASRSLTRLILDKNQIGDEGAVALGHAMRDSQDCRLQKLELYNCGIGAAGAEGLAAGIAVSRSLSSIE